MNKIKDIVVIKVGTSTLTKEKRDGTFSLDRKSFRRIGQQVNTLQEAGTHMIIVSSSGITAGMAVKGWKQRPDKQAGMPELQMLASLGWHHLVRAWEQALPGKTVGGMLLTDNELSLSPANSLIKQERRQAMEVTYALLQHGHVPVINENDAVAHEEIAIGDNDTLAAMFAAQLAESDLFGRNPAGNCSVRLVILSDVDGVYQDKDDASTRIPQIDNIAEYAHLAGSAGSLSGTGGMVTKFKAAGIATAHRVPTWITNGRAENALERTFAGEIGTYFPIPVAT